MERLDPFGELEAAWHRSEVHAHADELGIYGTPRDAMLLDPARAVRVMRWAQSQRGASNPAGLAIARFRSGYDPAPARPADDAEPEPGPPTLSAIEFMWSKSPETQAIIGPLMSAAIGGRYGGFDAIAPSFQWTDVYDDDGELIERRPN